MMQAALVPCVVMVVVAAGCGIETDEADPGSVTSGSVTSSTGETGAGTMPPLTTLTPINSPTSTTSTTTTSTTVTPSEPCDTGPAMVIATEALDAARLIDWDANWKDPTADGAFVERTTDPERLALVLGFECSWSGTQHLENAERLAVAAWTGNHLAMVIQTTDGPTEPYSQDRTVDIMFDAPEGELVAEDTWAVTLTGGESLILLVRNTGNLGFLAKTWLAEYAIVLGGDPGESATGKTATEQMALPALQAAGGRTVHVTEDSHGFAVSVLSLVSPSGDILFVTVGPVDQFDAFGYLTRGEIFDQDINGTPVRFVDPDDGYPASETAFSCNGFGWAIEADDGDIAETTEFIVALIDKLDCH